MRGYKVISKDMKELGDKNNFKYASATYSFPDEDDKSVWFTFTNRIFNIFKFISYDINFNEYKIFEIDTLDGKIEHDGFIYKSNSITLIDQISIDQIKESIYNECLGSFHSNNPIYTDKDLAMYIIKNLPDNRYMHMFLKHVYDEIKVVTILNKLVSIDDLEHYYEHNISHIESGSLIVEAAFIIRKHQIKKFDNENDTNKMIKKLPMLKRYTIAALGYCIDTLIKDPCELVRAATIKNGMSYGVEYLSHDSSSIVRKEVAKNGYNLNELKLDPDVSVRKEVLNYVDDGAILYNFMMDRDDDISSLANYKIMNLKLRFFNINNTKEYFCDYYNLIEKYSKRWYELGKKYNINIIGDIDEMIWELNKAIRLITYEGNVALMNLFIENYLIVSNGDKYECIDKEIMPLKNNYKPLLIRLTRYSIGIKFREELPKAFEKIVGRKYSHLL